MPYNVILLIYDQFGTLLNIPELRGNDNDYLWAIYGDCDVIELSIQVEYEYSPIRTIQIVCETKDTKKCNIKTTQK